MKNKPRNKFAPHMGITRREFLRMKRRQSHAVIRSLDAFVRGCAYLPPGEDCNAGGHISAIMKWIKGPCRKAWRKS